MKYTLILSILILLIGCDKPKETTVDAMVADALKNIETISPDQAMKIFDGEEVFNLIDVREKDEFYYGYIPGAVVMPRGRLEFSIDNPTFWETEGLYLPNKEEIFVVYCKKGKRSILAAKTLKQLGYKKVMVLDGGWKKWELTYPDYTEKNLEMLSGGDKDHGDTGGC